MPFIKEIVEIINTNLASTKLSDDARFIKKLHGLTDLQPVNYENTQEVIPTLIDITGNTTFSGFDDAYSIVIYHRCTSITTLPAPVQFGDGGNTNRENAQMKLVCFADRQRTQLTPQQLGFIISAGIQQQLKQNQITNYPGLYGVNIEATSVQFDGPTLFSAEYKLPALAYNLGPNDMYFSIDYSIITDYDIKCISDCPTC